MKIGNGVFSSDWLSLGRNVERAGYCIKYWRRYGFLRTVFHLEVDVLHAPLIIDCLRPLMRPGRAWRKLLAEAEHVDVAITLHFNGGGGAGYLDRVIQHETDVLHVVVRNTGRPGWLYVEAWRDGRRRKAMLVEGLEFFRSVPAGKLRQLLINCLTGWYTYCGAAAMSETELQKIICEIISLSDATGAKLLYPVHDFYAACPGMNFFDREEKFCGSGLDLDRCRRCLEGKRIDIVEWRKAHAELLKRSAEIRCFSEDSRRRMIAVFGDYGTYTIVPHLPLCEFRPVKIPDESHTVIGVVGPMIPHKGLRPVEHLAHYIAEKKLDAEIVVVGDVPETSSLRSLARITGRYPHDKLPQIIESLGVNAAFFASVWPETFSYVTQELMMMNLPLVCLNLGAQAERVAKYPRGVITESAAPEDV